MCGGLFIKLCRGFFLMLLSLSCLSCDSRLSSAPIDLGERGREAAVVVDVKEFGAHYIAVAFPRGSTSAREIERVLLEGGRDVVRVTVTDEHGKRVFEEDVVGAIGDGSRGWDFGKGTEVVALRKMAVVRLEKGRYVVRMSVVSPDNGLQGVRAYLICFAYDPKI